MAEPRTIFRVRRAPAFLNNLSTAKGSHMPGALGLVLAEHTIQSPFPFPKLAPELQKMVIEELAKDGFFVEDGVGARRLAISRQWYNLALPVFLGNNVDIPLTITPDKLDFLIMRCGLSLAASQEPRQPPGYPGGALYDGYGQFLSGSVRALKLELKLPTESTFLVIWGEHRSVEIGWCDRTDNEHHMLLTYHENKVFEANIKDFGRSVLANLHRLHRLEVCPPSAVTMGEQLWLSDDAERTMLEVLTTAVNRGYTTDISLDLRRPGKMLKDVPDVFFDIVDGLRPGITAPELYDTLKSLHIHLEQGTAVLDDPLQPEWLKQLKKKAKDGQKPLAALQELVVFVGKFTDHRVSAALIHQVKHLAAMMGSPRRVQIMAPYCSGCEGDGWWVAWDGLNKTLSQDRPPCPCRTDLSIAERDHRGWLSFWDWICQEADRKDYAVMFDNIRNIPLR